MALITWSRMLSTGINEHDTQHKKLIDLINQLNDAMLAGHGTNALGTVLAEMVNYTVLHFDHEEKLMEKHKYEDAQAHKAEHAKFVQTTGEFKKRFDSGHAVASAEIMDFLRGWLISHIMKTDKRFAHALNKAMVKQGSVFDLQLA
jgi:hemerythrin